MITFPLKMPVFLFALFALLCLSTFNEAKGNAITDPHIRERRTLGRSRSRQGPRSSQLSDVLQRFSADGSFLGGDLSLYTPTTPRPEDVNCHVEVPTTTLVGGRCISLGGASSVCQAGAYLAFTAECQSASPSSRFRRTSGTHPQTGPAFQMPNRRGNGNN
ncbi:hypothetical protein ElyMa_003820100 [Elysia marginata]|uniref:SUEL-type lectin domain-containing protein n=1 Tax=Elysia marginata TaxID=1093978 RepID=A0AAV4FEL4_9GAST|nr:hypothetical protein ElyMa_003820100 [Elysia marginata]